MYEKELTYAVEAAQIAAYLLRESFVSGYQEEVDEQAEQRIFELLTDVFPLYGYRGEKLGLRRHPRGERKHLWLIDPHDGTSAAKAGYRGGAVSIALLCNGFPVLGVVYAYAAPDSRGDLFTWAAGLRPVRRNGLKLPTLGNAGFFDTIEYTGPKNHSYSEWLKHNGSQH